MRSKIPNEHRDRLLALSQAAIEMQGVHSDAEIYAAAGKAILEIGFYSIVLGLKEDRQHLGLLYSNIEADKIRNAEQLLGIPKEKLSLSVFPGSRYFQTLSENKTLFFDKDPEFTDGLVPGVPGPVWKKLYGLFAIYQSIYAPLSIAGKAKGLLIVTGRDLSPEDVPFVTVFATQIAIALENAQLYDTLRTHADALEQRFRERTAALRESEANARAILSAAPESILMIDPASMILTVNETGAKRMNQRVEGMIGHNLFEFIPPELAPNRRARINEVIRTGQPVQFEDIRWGRNIENYLHPVLDNEKRVVRIVIFGRDVTERKKAEEEIRSLNSSLEKRVAERTEELATANRNLNLEISERKKAEHRLEEALELNRKIIEASNVGAIAYNSSGECILVNDAMARITNVTAEALRKQNFRHILSWQQSGMLNLAEQALSENTGKRGEFFMVASSGKETGLDCYFAPFLIGGDQHLLLLASDISERMRAERELNVYATQLERSNRELQDFAFIASHDLQEPLRKIQAFGELLKTKYGQSLSQEGADYIDRMYNAATRMRTLIDDLLAYSRVTTKSQPFVKTNLNIILEDVLSDLEIRIKECGGRVETGELPPIHADPMQMQQLLQNLVSNALKFRKPDVPPVVKIYARIADDQIHPTHFQLCVEDNGIGFDERYLDRIFMPFQRLHSRTAYEGSGMGLAICRKIAERHHGSITAKSSPSQGTTFIVTLPLYADIP